MSAPWEWFAHSPVPVQTAWISGIISVLTITVTLYFSKKNTDKALKTQAKQFEKTRAAEEKKHHDELEQRRIDRFNDEKLELAREVLAGIREATDDIEHLLFKRWDSDNFYNTLSSVPLLFSEPVIEVAVNINREHRKLVKLYEEHHQPGNSPTTGCYLVQSDKLRALSSEFIEVVKKDMGIL